MERPTTTMLRIGAWCVNPASGQISRDGEAARVEVRTMRLLTCLAEHAGEVVSIDDLLSLVWPDVIVSPDSVYQAVASLRRLRGDDSKEPTYIETVPRLGYRMVAMVIPWVAASAGQAGAQTGALRTTNSEHSTPATPDVLANDAAEVPKKSGAHLRIGFMWASAAMLCLALVVAFLFYGKVTQNNPPASSTNGAIPPPPRESIAVLPFPILPYEMNQHPSPHVMPEQLTPNPTTLPALPLP